VRALISDVGDFLGEDRGPGPGAGPFGRLTCLWINDSNSVELIGLVGKGGSISVAFFGHRMHNYRATVGLGRSEGVLHGLEVVSVHRTDVLHAQIFKHSLGRPPVLDALLHGVQALVGELTYGTTVLELLLPPVKHPLIGRRRPQSVDGGAQGCQVVGKTAHSRCIKAAVVVDHNHHAAPLISGNIIDGFPGHATSEGTVPYNRDDEPVAFAGQLPGAGNAVCPGQRRGSVGAFDDVMLGFGAVGVTGESTLLPERTEVLPAREELVDIGLVPGVKDYAVPGRLEDAMQSKRELDDAEVGTQVSTRSGYVGNQEVPDLAGQLFQLLAGQFGQVLWILDGFQESQRPSLG